MRENKNSDAARLQVTSPEELLQWMSDNITYELANDEYGEEDDPPTKTAAEVIETGTGHCAEQSYLAQEVLEQLGYDTQLVFVKENNTKDDYGADGSAHMFLTFVDDAGNHYWFEHAMQHARGIHRYGSMDQLLHDVADQWWRYDEDSDVLEVRFIPQPITGVDNWQLAKRCHKYPVEAKLDISSNVMEKDIPLEAEWDFDNKRVLDESLAPTIYFLSDKDMDGRTLTPRVPSNYMTRNGYEDGETPRVCFAKSIDGALKGLSQNLTGKEFYVHTPVAIDSRYLHTPSREEVPDASITTEVWYTQPVKIKTVGKIKVVSDDGKDGLPYTYGDGESAELYGWNWKWEDNPTEDTLSEARKRKKKRTRGHSVNYQPNVGDMSYTIDVFNRMMGNSHATGMAAADPVGASMTMTMMEELDSEPWYEGMTLDDKFHYLKHTFPHVDGNWALKVPEDIVDNIHDWAEALREVMHDNPTLAENAAIADGGWVVFAPTDGVTANYIDYANSDSVDEWVAYLSGDDSQPTEEATKEITDGIERDFLAVDKFNENINKIFNIVLGEPTEMSESKKINLRESIAALDHASENEYGLTALYEALELDATKKHKLAEMLAQGGGALAVYRKLVEWYDEEEEEEDDFTSYFVDDEEDTCPECGMRLNDSGTCPHCDHGESEVLTELGPVAGAVIAAAVPAVVDKLLDDDMDRDSDPERAWRAKECSYEIAKQIAQGAKRALRLPTHEVEMLEHDINNLRSDEWVEQFLRLPEGSKVKQLFFTHAVAEDETLNENNKFRNARGEVMADKWYASRWPDDEVGIEQLAGLTLDELLKNRSLLGHCDTQVRDRVSAQLDKYVPLSESVSDEGRFELSIWVPGSGGDDERERTILRTNSMDEVIDTAYDTELDSDEAFYLTDWKGIYTPDLDQCYDAEDLEDQVSNVWHYSGIDDLRKTLGRMLLPHNEALEESARSITLNKVRTYLARKNGGSLSKEELDTLAQEIYEVLKREEAKSGSSYPSVEAADIEDLFDSSDKGSVIRELGYKWMGLESPDRGETLDEGLFGDYKPYGEFTEEDIELHKSIDWDARNYEDYPVEDDTFVGEAVVYTDRGELRKKVTFMKFLRSNPIYPPYYRPVSNPFFKGALGPMYDGQRHGDYDVHNRYESQSVYDALSESYAEDEDKPFTKTQLADELRRETKKWTIVSDSIVYGFKEEADYAVKLLSKHYRNVEKMPGKRSGDWRITFSDPVKASK